MIIAARKQVNYHICMVDADGDEQPGCHSVTRPIDNGNPSLQNARQYAVELLARYIKEGQYRIVGARIYRTTSTVLAIDTLYQDLPLTKLRIK